MPFTVIFGLLLTASAWTPAQDRFLPGKPDLRGEIIEVYAEAIYVREQREQKFGIVEAVVAIPPEAPIFGWERTGPVPRSMEDLKEGLSVLVWYADRQIHPIFPLRVTARAILILAPEDQAGLPDQVPLPEDGDVPIRVGANVFESHLIEAPAPVYPEEARRRRIMGVVLLQVTVDRDGRVERVQVVRGHPLLAMAAQEAVAKWRYKPFMLKGETVRAIGTVAIRLFPER